MIPIMPSNIDNRLGARRWFIHKRSEVMNYWPAYHNETWERCVKSHFRVASEVLFTLDHSLNLQSAENREHLLWALNFLKVYNSETVSARFWNVSEKTYRKYLHPMIDRIAGASLVGY